MPDARLVVVYDETSSATPAEICASLAVLAELIFVVPMTEHVARMRGVLDAIGTVVPDADGPVSTARILKPLLPNGVLTFSESMLSYASSLAGELGLPYHDGDVIRLVTDKWLLRQRLRAAGVETLRTSLVIGPHDFAAALRDVGLPAVVKPIRDSGANRHVYRVDSTDQVPQIADRMFSDHGPWEHFIVEECLIGRDMFPLGDYVSVESMVCNGEVTHIGFTGKFPLKPPFRSTGQFRPALLPEDERRELSRQMSAVIGAVGLRSGLLHGEFKLTSDGPRLIEFNGRMGGFMRELTLNTTGVDVVALAGRLALGEHVRVVPPPARRIAFQHWHLVPLLTCRVEAVTGVAAVRDLPAIRSCRIITPPGTLLDGGVSVRRLVFLSGTCDSHETLLPTLRKALSLLSFTLSFAHGTRTIDGLALNDITENLVESEVADRRTGQAQSADLAVVRRQCDGMLGTPAGPSC